MKMIGSRRNFGLFFNSYFIYIVLFSSSSLCEQNFIEQSNNDQPYLYIEEYGLNISVIYNKQSDILQFHLHKRNDSAFENLKVTVTTQEGTICDQIHLDEDINKIDTFIPTVLPFGIVAMDEKLSLGCTYDIQVSDDSTLISGPTFSFSIPNCVDNKCDCNHYSIPVNLTVEHKKKDEFLIEWIFGNPEDMETVENVTFSVYEKEYCEEAPSSSELMEPKYTFLETNNSVLVYTENRQHFCLLIDFTNKYGCLERILKRLEAKAEPVEDLSWVHILYTFILVFLLLVIIALWYIDKCRGTIKGVLISRVLSRRRYSHHNIYGDITNRSKKIESNLLYIEGEIIDGLVDSFELPRNHLKVLNEIGKGAFGEVYFGKAYLNGKEESVAVKTLREKSTNDEMDDFLSEIEIMKKIGQHPNIVTMLKCCTLQEPYMMVMEYVPYGDLKHYLVNLRDKWNRKRNECSDDVYNESGSYIKPNTPRQFEKTKKPSTSTEYTNLSITPTSLDHFTFDIDQSSVLDHNELQNFALQIACGMAHLEKIPITHRDLAARNILIDGNKVLKISDFGLSRPGPYINKSHNKLPLRWMALEAIEDHIYDNKSDIWSFGIVLWEIGTLGAFPYDDVPDRMLIYHLHVGKRLPRPEICTDELYTLMLRCWSEDPKLRPTFEELVQQLDVTKSQIYIDFSQLNPTYVFPPMKSQNRYNNNNKQVDERYSKENDKKSICQDNVHVSKDKEKYLECP